MPAPSSPFYAFLCWSEWLHSQVGRTDGIALVRLMELLFSYLTGRLHLQPDQVGATLWRDYQRGGRSDKPAFLKPFLSSEERRASQTVRPATLKRQARHHYLER
jgi:hypothetical protein